mgnify:CR=1 FL=1
MITWTYSTGNICHLVGFNKYMRKIAEIVEVKNDWRMFVGKEEYRVKGNGCADPIEYLERIASPVANRHISDKDEWVLHYHFDNGEIWEVYRE